MEHMTIWRRGVVKAPTLLAVGMLVLGIAACGGSSGALIEASPSVTATGVPSATVPAPGETEDAAPTVSVFAQTDAPADQVLASASEAVQKTPDEVMSAIARLVVSYQVQGPVQYARVSKSSVFTKRMKWFPDDELDGITYLVVVPHRQERMHYLLVTARPATDLRQTYWTQDTLPADLTSLGKVQSLTQDDLESVSDWRPFMNRSPEPTKGRWGE
ncbi:hypothetical protein Kisp02_13380 [Kineosporia sp. NBRC 101731]|nr:hypothetical protein Kisp02_13380 [Kineosporia sp. NBRC 101731]